jgi:hypothetical protein
MNRKLLKSAVLFGLFLPSLSFAQMDDLEIDPATISSEYCITLSTDSDVQEYYVLDIAHLGISTKAEGQDKFGFIENNLISYEVDLITNTATMQLHLDRTSEPKDVIWWSEYLNSLCGL